MRVWLLAAAALFPCAPAWGETLGDALHAAYRNNPTLQSAELAVGSAREGRRQAFSDYLPQVEINAAYGVRSDETIQPPFFPGFPPSRSVDQIEPASAALVANQQLYTGGARRGQMRLARANHAAAQENFRAVEQQVLLDVVSVYVDVRTIEELVRIRERNVEMLTRELQAARDRLAVGEVTRTDEAQAIARLSGAQAELARARADLEVARANYVQIIGELPQSLAPAPPAPEGPESLEAALDAAFEANPDLREARQVERGAQARIGIQAGALRPSLSLVGRMDTTEDVEGREIETNSASATAQLRVPLFEGGFMSSRLRQSRIDARRAKLNVEEIRRQVVAQVTAAWNDLAANRRVVEASNAQVEAARVALDGVIQEQAYGLRTTLDTLNAQQELLAAETALLRADRDVYVAEHALLAATGRLNAGVFGLSDRQP